VKVSGILNLKLYSYCIILTSNYTNQKMNTKGLKIVFNSTQTFPISNSYLPICYSSLYTLLILEYFYTIYNHAIQY